LLGKGFEEQRGLKMKAMKRLAAHLERRPQELGKLKSEGAKIIGYIPTGFVPEELIWASGAVPVGLIRGGDPEAVAASGAYLPRFYDTFCRAQIGYRILGIDYLYQIVDLLVVPVIDNNMRALGDSWAFFTDVEVFQCGIPRTKDALGHQYYLASLHELRKKLEDFTGAEIDDDKLRRYIDLYNRMKELLREISLLRKSERPPISGKDFATLHHASFYAEPFTFVDVLESLLQELRGKEAPVRGPRVLLIGSTLASGDYKILDIAEGLGAAIVVEDFSEGIRPYWEKVEADEDPLRGLAKTYFIKRAAPAFFFPSQEGTDFLLKLAEDFKVDGALWYNLMFRDSYDVESFHFERLFKEKLGLPMLRVYSDYARAEEGPLRTRIETFIETTRWR
jgi:benzoyl-CoA reductase/2-hydroxyglutaryl-CoA dehydratase subunit BcrC/BadD/HgdB